MSRDITIRALHTATRSEVTGVISDNLRSYAEPQDYDTQSYNISPYQPIYTNRCWQLRCFSGSIMYEEFALYNSEGMLVNAGWYKKTRWRTSVIQTSWPSMRTEFPNVPISDATSKKILISTLANQRCLKIYVNYARNFQKSSYMCLTAQRIRPKEKKNWDT